VKTETIAAIATALSNSGIGIVRISGDDAIEIADSIFRAKNKEKKLVYMKSHTIHYGFIYDNENLIDEVMVVVMKGPNTYTREDTIEINCHGGILVMNHILETVLKYGARLAEPGEFTKRAFLNGRIDLSKAEAVMDLIESKNDFAMKSSINQLSGRVSKEVVDLREGVLSKIAYIEAAIDDPENYELEQFRVDLEKSNKELIGRINYLIKLSENGKILKDGIRTVIVGKPNAGKSSFLNKMIGEDKAIVTDIAGTTRDVLEEQIRVHGIGLHIIDTAGIRSTEDIVEKIGVSKAKEYAEDSDLIIYIVDSSVPMDENDEDIVKLIGEKKVIVLYNKTDLNPMVSIEDIYDLFDNTLNRKKDSYHIIKTSTLEEIGLKEFEETIEKMFLNQEIIDDNEVFITNMRHKEALMDTLTSLEHVEQSLNNDMPEDFLSIDLMSAYESLGYIIGEQIGEDLVNEIFSKFCMGK
jgi:tRNA modification GTPase